MRSLPASGVLTATSSLNPLHSYLAIKRKKAELNLSPACLLSKLCYDAVLVGCHPRAELLARLRSGRCRMELCRFRHWIKAASNHCDCFLEVRRNSASVAPPVRAASYIFRNQKSH